MEKTEVLAKLEQYGNNLQNRISNKNKLFAIAMVSKNFYEGMSDAIKGESFTEEEALAVVDIVRLNVQGYYTMPQPVDSGKPEDGCDGDCENCKEPHAPKMVELKKKLGLK